jgi:D-aminopeptidase
LSFLGDDESESTTLPCSRERSRAARVRAVTAPLPPRGPRPRERGIRIGAREPGPANAITDVAGVRVGHATVWRDEPGGRGCARTGVTAILPAPAGELYREPVPAGVAVLNGAGEMTGFVAVSEWGLVETPVYLTSTMAVGRIYDGAVAQAVAADPLVGTEEVVIPVVTECDDSWLSDSATVQVEAADAGRALAAARGGTPDEGAVGAGTGMICFGWKGGIGTSSRLVPEAGATVGVLVLANFGSPRELRVDGVPVGRLLPDPEAGVRAAAEDGAPAAQPRDPGTRPPAGSCIAVVATDAPLAPAQLERLARRAGLGLGRTGSVAHHGSGEIFLAFATGGRVPRAEFGRRRESFPDAGLDDLFSAAVDATEEAVIGALWAAPDVTGRRGRTAPGLPHDEVLALLRAHGRVGS